VFLGKFEHQLDEKGRLVLPAAFRPSLDNGGVLAPWERCLALWAPGQFDEVAQMLKRRISEGGGDMDVMRVFFAAAHTVHPDRQGRFVIPEDHRARAGLSREVVVSGQFDRIEVWDRERFNELHDVKAPQLDDVIRDLRM
jgi:transcriptional regulator MraZ